MYEAAVAKLERRPADLQGAMMKVRLAAERGYNPAKIRLAWSYIFGEGVELDVEKAKKIFEALANEGNADAHAVSIPQIIENLLCICGKSTIRLTIILCVIVLGDDHEIVMQLL